MSLAEGHYIVLIAEHSLGTASSKLLLQVRKGMDAIGIFLHPIGTHILGIRIPAQEIDVWRMRIQEALTDIPGGGRIVCNDYAIGKGPTDVWAEQRRLPSQKNLNEGAE